MDKNLVNTALNHAMAKPFVWGQDDCCSFVCDLVLAQTGKDFMAPLRGTYDSEQGTLLVMKTYGGGLVETAIALAKLANLKPANWPWAGDLIGVVAASNGPMLAVFFEGAWLVRTISGSARVRPSQGVIAWEIN